MNESETVDALWDELKADFLLRHEDIAQGRMMTADALTFGGKVFVFRSRRNGHGLGCKLGETTPDRLEASRWKPLKPWADKAAMRGWFVIGPEDAPLWQNIAAVALEHAREQAGATA